jgi:hypothetical protein
MIKTLIVAILVVLTFVGLDYLVEHFLGQPRVVLQ